MVVYIDVYFLLNFIMDIIILTGVRFVVGNVKSCWRIVPAAITGALYACVVLVGGFGGIIECFFTYIVISVLMTLIAFGYGNKRILIDRITLVFVVTFLLSGMVNQLYYKHIILGMKGIIISGILCMILIVVVSKLYGIRKSNGNRMRKVTLVKNEKYIEIKALIDTGNSLREPISKKPVAVVCSEVVNELNKREEGVMVIPYSSVGKEQGILYGFVADYMVITKADEFIGAKDKEAEIKIVKPILATYDGKFTSNNDYQMLLHPDMVREGDTYV